MEGNLKFIDGIIIGTVDEAVFVNGTNKTIAENNPLFECERINLYDKNNPDSHIKVKPNTTYYFTGGEMKYFTYYDISDTQISTYNSYGNDLTTPANCAYIKIKVAVISERENFVFTEFQDKLAYTDYNKRYIVLRNDSERQSLKVALSGLVGKTLNCLGDSITNGAAGTSYGEQISKKYFMNYNNYGINSNALTADDDAGSNNPMCIRYSQMSDDADIIFVMPGYNDSTAENKLGTQDSTDKKTFYGAMKILCEGLIRKYPTKTILFSTYPNTGSTTETAIKTYPRKCEIIKEVCSWYSIPCLDLYACGGLTGQIKEQQDLYYPVDGYHPSTEGYTKILPAIENFILQHVS